MQPFTGKRGETFVTPESESFSSFVGNLEVWMNHYPWLSLTTWSSSLVVLGNVKISLKIAKIKLKSVKLDILGNVKLVGSAQHEDGKRGNGYPGSSQKLQSLPLAYEHVHSLEINTPYLALQKTERSFLCRFKFCPCLHKQPKAL